jgi:hypothetical protein
MEPSQSQSNTDQYNDKLHLYTINTGGYNHFLNVLLNLAIQIYKEGQKYGLQCGINMVRVLDSIKRYNNVWKDIIYDNDLIKIIQDAVITGCYSDEKSTKFSKEITDLANLKKDNETLFKKYVDEILEATSNPNNPGKFKIVLHSGFQKKVFGRRPGPSPNSTDQDGVFICKLRKAIVAFLKFYKITFELTDRFKKFDEDCDNAIKDATPLQASSQSSTDGSARLATDLQTSSQDSTRLSQPLSSEAIQRGYAAYFGPPIIQKKKGIQNYPKK